MEEKIVICISNVSSPQKKIKNPVIQKEKIKPQRALVFLLVNSFHEWDVPSWIWEWCIFKFPLNLIWISEDFWPDVEISCVNTLHDGQFSPGWFLEQLDHGGTVGLITAEPTVSLWCDWDPPRAQAAECEVLMDRYVGAFTCPLSGRCDRFWQLVCSHFTWLERPWAPALSRAAPALLLRCCLINQSHRFCQAGVNATFTKHY